MEGLDGALESDRQLQGERLRTEYSFEDGEGWAVRLEAAKDQLQRWWYLAGAGLLSLLCLLLCWTLHASLAIPLVPLLTNDLCILVTTILRIRSKPREEAARYHIKAAVENVSAVLFKCLLLLYLTTSPFPLWIAAGPLLADTVFQAIYRGKLQVDCSAFSELVRVIVVQSGFEGSQSSSYYHN